jgi:FixJ family two-component response regulator
VTETKESQKAGFLSDTPIVAIVDDDQAVRDALFDLLQVEGLPASFFDSADAFLADRLSCDHRVLVTDVRMPGMDGLELQQTLRAMGSSMPVIFVSSVSDPQIRQRALEQGAFAYLAKPAGDELLNQIRFALGRDRTRPGD